jgi:hypothetical protein
LPLSHAVELSQVIMGWLQRDALVAQPLSAPSSR